MASSCEHSNQPSGSIKKLLTTEQLLATQNELYFMELISWYIAHLLQLTSCEVKKSDTSNVAFIAFSLCIYFGWKNKNTHYIYTLNAKL
jgi:hypothetical protein